MIACYCRVSSRNQKHDSQKAEIRRWLRAQRIPRAKVQWFEDMETGTSLQRPAFERLQQAVFAGTVQTVVVWKLDRLSRRQHEGITLLTAWCEQGVRVISVTQ
jgi:DNA invertase Pin-like site-specific DNA recombinase